MGVDAYVIRSADNTDLAVGHKGDSVGDAEVQLAVVGLNKLCNLNTPVDIYDFVVFFFFQAEDGIRDYKVTGVQTCALPILTLRKIHIVRGHSNVPKTFVAKSDVIRFARSRKKVGDQATLE